MLRPRSARAFPDRGEAELAGHPDGAGRGVVGRAGQARAGAGLAAPGLASDAPTSFSVKKVRTPPMKCRITAKLTVELGGVPFGRTACRRRCAHLRCTHPSSRPDRGHVGRRRRQRADKRGRVPTLRVSELWRTPMVQPCGPCRMLVWKRAWQERPHAGLTAIRDEMTTWRSSSGRRTQFRCRACGAMLVRSRLTRLEPGWRVGHLSSAYGLQA